jgi:hypothetical protein
VATERAADAHRAGVHAEVEELRRRTADELGRARAQVERELTRLRELQGVARAELTRIAATIRAELSPTSRPSPRPTRRAEAPPVAGPRTAPTREPTGGASDDTTTPYRFATAGR